jgi:predicted secreted protein
MSVATFFAIYGISWWLSLFMVLPLGVRSQEEAGEVTPGTEPGAPVAPRLLFKLLVTSLVAIPVAIGLALFIRYSN